jgi:hypothetical protein
MKSFVVHVQDSVCAQNNRDPEAASLIEAARSFGTVETLDAALSAQKSKYEIEIAKLKTQHEAIVDELNAKLTLIEEKGVTAEELEVLRVIRAKSDREAEGYKATIAERDNMLNAWKLESENRAAQIAAMFGFTR